MKYENVIPNRLNTRHIYSLPKVSKKCRPLRSMHAMTEVPYRSLTIWLSHALQPILKVLSANSFLDTLDLNEIVKMPTTLITMRVLLVTASLFTDVQLIKM